MSTDPVVNEGIKEVDALSENNVNVVNEAVNYGMFVSTNYVVKTSLKCFLNVRGLLGKLDELKVLIYESGLDIVNC
jgi:DNA-binding MltR family transcriptional regulator